MGLFGVSLRTLGMAPGCHGAVPLQQPTINLIGYCTGGASPPLAPVPCLLIAGAFTLFLLFVLSRGQYGTHASLLWHAWLRTTTAARKEPK